MTPRLALPTLAVAALLAGCGSASSTSATTSRSNNAAASSLASPSSSTSAQPPAPVTASHPAAGGARVSTPYAAAPPAAGAPQAAAAPAAAPATAPGTYTYDNSGTVTAGTPQDASGTSTLTVDAPAAGKQHSTLAGQEGRTEQDVVVRQGGTYLARLVIANPAFTKEFRPPSTALLVPDPAPVGRSWSWRTTSTDGKTTATVTARVVRKEALTIGGRQVATSVVASTLRLTGDISYTAQMQTWYDAADRLSAKEHTKGSGSYGGFAFTTDITSVLRSTRPS